MLVSKTETVTRVERHEIELDASTLRDLLNRGGAEIPEQANIRIYFAVPGGADWSNTDIDIDASNPVRVEWTITEERRG